MRTPAASTALALCAFVSKVVAQSGSVTIGGLSGSHTDIPRWCGKPYMAGSPNFPPGGMLEAPVPAPTPNLFVRVEPRHSIYDSSEKTADFIVDASISYTHGSQFSEAAATTASSTNGTFGMLNFDIRIEGTDQLLVSDVMEIGSTDKTFNFDISMLKPRLQPYHVVLFGTPMHQMGAKTYEATTKLYYLPAKNSGSTVKVDNLYGGMLVANNVTNYAFEPLLPFGFYTSCSGYLNYSIANVSAYKDLGFNAVNPVCAFTDGDLGFLFDWLDETNLWYQYDMRGSYLNLTSLEEQIPLVKDRSAFLSWYTADEPDGWQYALNSTQLAYIFLKEKDPYHPTSLVLNCDNYYFGKYSSGADYIMEDAYPVGINPTFSRPWNTTCNETYGDCGCDDCVGELQDVSNRLDTLFNYQDWLGNWQKPLWAVLQAFSGEGYWNRNPSSQETWAMMMLSFNHKAKAVMSWMFPSTNSLNHAHGAFAKVATTSPVSKFLLGDEPKQIKVNGRHQLDVSFWEVGEQIMVGVVNLDYVNRRRAANIELPMKVKRIVEQPWGSMGWTLVDSGNNSSALSTHKLLGLDTSFVILDM